MTYYQEILSFVAIDWVGKKTYCLFTVALYKSQRKVMSKQSVWLFPAFLFYISVGLTDDFSPFTTPQ